MSEDAINKISYKRVLLKISGEALMGDLSYGLNPPTVERIAQEIKIVHQKQEMIILKISEYRGIAIHILPMKKELVLWRR